ncbi:MAG: hypothetical protein EU547_06795 [Promethearchaeota archaeon]|nr:MAG: hypothetical protein EU547_06795 [Candidatus Lokiarchaeota archaeon]
MKDLDNTIFRIGYFIKSKYKVIFHVISSLALLETLLFLTNIIDLGVLQYFIGLYLILLFPTYPLFFNIIKRDKLSLLEKLVFTVMSNMSLYIIIGFFGNLIGFYLNGLFFFYFILIIYGALIVIILYDKSLSDYKHNDIKEKIEIIPENFSWYSHIKTKIINNLNGILLTIFLIFICLLYLILVSTFTNSDSWLHVTIIKIIDIKGYLPTQDYYNAMGIHIYSTVYYFFSNVNIFMIPRYFTTYSIFLSGVLLYIIFKKIFKNTNLAVFGVFLLEFSSLGFIRIVNSFWPETLAVLQSLMILYLLYSRGQKFVEFDHVSIEEIKKNLLFSYILVILLFIGSTLTHSLITAIFLIAYLWVYLIYFIKDYRRGFDFIILIFLCVILAIFVGFNIGVGHLVRIITGFSEALNFPFYYYLIAIGGVAIILIPLIRKFIRGIRFGKKDIIFQYKREQIIKKQRIEKKFVVPLAIMIMGLLTTFLLVANNLIFNLNIQTLFTIIEILLIGIFATWGFIWFQKSSRGEFLYILFVGFALILALGFFYNLLFAGSTIWPRILELFSPFIAIGFVSYMYKIIKLRLVKNRKIQIFIISVIIISLFISISEISYFAKLFSFEQKELKPMQDFSQYSSDKKVIIVEFGERLPFFFYDYPYETTDKDFEAEDIHYFIYMDDQYLRPELHMYDNGTNRLIQLKEDYGTDVYLFLTRYYFRFETWTFYSGLTDQEVEQYYNLSYLNRIYSSKPSSGNEKPIYWVI